MHSESSSPLARDVHRAITEKIVDAIKAGAGTFQMPWHRGANVTRPVNAHTKTVYRGINVIALWVQSMTRGYLSGYWATYRQWQKLGAQVNRGQHGTVIVFYKKIEPSPSTTGDEQDNPRRSLFARASRVFNAEQVTGWEPPSPEPKTRMDTLAEVEDFTQRTGALIRHGGDEAYYNRKHDEIVVPPRGLFKGTSTSSPMDSYYAVLLHEMTHWTGAPHRLAREFGQRFGDNAYAVEELVAELGSAFLCADLGITNEPRPDHASYVASWLNVLKRDPKAVFTAASRASAGADYLANLVATARSA
ncbi:zincin-like metallopeptidase domain-containing protein [Emcibacter sp. SYSU 3D8]|uniref:ArdC family protein n=1 Tax=Emcibacter sp. SYSU 3D8 TaxID=3133969 RepID=UPI0031FEE5BD